MTQCSCHDGLWEGLGVRAFSVAPTQYILTGPKGSGVSRARESRVADFMGPQGPGLCQVDTGTWNPKSLAISEEEK